LGSCGESGLLGELLLSLAVFPADTRIPVATVIRYWVHIRRQAPRAAESDLQRLAASGLLQLHDSYLEFHDLQYEYLLLHSPHPAKLHGDLLESYSAQLIGGFDTQWWRMPLDEPYIGDHLALHLRGAGRHAELVRTATDPAYVVRRLIAGGPHAAEADLAQAALVEPDDALVSWWQSWITRHAHLLTAAGAGNGSAVSTSVVTTTSAWLRADPTHHDVDVDPSRLDLVGDGLAFHVAWGLTSPPMTLVRVLARHIGAVLDARFSPDGSQIVSGGADRSVRIWDAQTGEQLTVISGHNARVLSTAWSPDGATVSSVAFGDPVVVWDAASGNELANLSVQFVEKLTTHAWSSDRYLIAGDDYGSVPVWDGRKNLEVGSLGFRQRIHSIDCSPDGTKLVVGGDDGRIKIFQKDSRTELYTISGRTVTAQIGHSGTVYAVAWALDGSRVASAGDNGSVRIWDALAGRQLLDLVGHAGAVRAVAWSPDSERIASGGDDRVVRIWNAHSGEEIQDLPGHVGAVHAVDWPPDGALLLSAAADRSVRLWNPAPARREMATSGRAPGPIRALRWSPDGELLASGAEDGCIYMWDRAGGLRNVLAGHTGRVRAVDWSPNGEYLATASEDSTVRIWHAATATETAIFHGHQGWVGAVAWSPAAAQVVSAGQDLHLRVWDVGRTTLQSRMVRHLRPMNRSLGWLLAASWAPDGSMVATASVDRSISFWNVRTGRRVLSYGAHDGAVRCLAWGPDGAWLASGSDDGSLRVWKAGTTTLQAGFEGHFSVVQAVVWSPDSRNLITGGKDGRVLCWALESGQPLAYVQMDEVNSISWGVIGIAVGGDNGTAVFELR
jgi:WD40 repeat protein